MAFWGYILRCADSSYYTGHTDNLEIRICQHTTGAIDTCYTFKRRPLELVFSQEFPTRVEALASEQQIKGWNRKKKEAMMRGDWAEVSHLARSTKAAQKKPVCSESFDTVRPELVEGTNGAQNRPVERRDLVDGQEPSVHGSTARQARRSGRTDGKVLL